MKTKKVAQSDTRRAVQKIVLVEDDYYQAEHLTEILKESFPQAEIVVFESENDFKQGFLSFQVIPPDLFIFDLMLPWKSLQSANAPTPPKGTSPELAGIRCAKAALGSHKTRKVPIIIHSVVSQQSLRAKFPNAPSNVHFRSKGVENEDLIMAIRSLLSVAQRHELRIERRDIFLVHGHDDEAKESVARFVEKLGGRVVILHEQPNAGRTIIEKFEHHANAVFAIVLLTPDDFGGRTAESLTKRSRQNVVFELGFFFAKLGRNKVCALHKEEVEIPSDIQGIIYTLMDKAGAWRTALARELKAAGIPLDYDKII